LSRAPEARSLNRVSRERLKSPRARLFVALDLPDDLRDKIVAWGRSELADPTLRPAAPSVGLEDPVAKPSLKRARLFALPALAPDALPLQRELERKLVGEQLYKPENRPFWPHVTVARVKSAGRGSRRPRRVERPPGALPKTLLEPALCVRVTLYRSVLQPQGSRYTPLAQVELSRDGRQ
jgi:2'-5' RNA ligase